MRPGILDQPSKTLKRLEDLVSGMDATADVQAAIQELRASLEAARADIGQLASAQADAIAHSALLISQVEEARGDADRARLFAEAARQQLDDRVRQRTAELHAANVQLQANQARYERAVTGVNDGIWEWNPHTGEDYLSPRWKQLLGYEDHELPNVQESFFNQVHPEDRPRIEGAIRAHFEERKPYEIELRLRCKNGEYRWFLSRGQATWDSQGRPVLMSGSISDITRRKESEEALRQLTAELEARVEQRTAALRESEERVTLLLNSSGEAIYGVDLDGNCTISNPACARLLGYDSPEQFLGKHMHTLIHHTRPDGTPYPTEECRMYQAFQRGDEVHVDDEVFWRADGTSIPVEYRSYPLRRDGKIIGAVAWFTDITVRRHNEELLRERARLTALTGDIGIALTRQGDLPSLLQAAAEALVHHLGAAFARIWTLDATANVLELRASAGLYTHLDGGHACVPVGKFKIGLIALERKPHLTNQVIGDPRVGDQEWARREGMVAFAGYPLIVGDRVWGVVAMFSRQPLAPTTVKTLAIVADEIGLGIARMATLESLQASEERLRQQHAALTALTHSGRLHPGDMAVALQLLTETAARTLGVARVSVWRYNPERTAIRCIDLYELEAHRHSSGQELKADAYPAYFRALAAEEVVAAHDAATHPATYEFTQSYLRPLGISSMMDAPIHVDGKVDGVVCHEQVGRGRTWTADEQTFAVAQANLVSLAVEAWERKRAEEQLRESEERFRQLAESIDEVFWITTPGHAQTLYVSPAFERVWGYPCPDLKANPRDWLEPIFPEDRERLLALIAASPDGGYDAEYRIRRPDHSMRWIHDRGFPVRDATGTVCRIAGLAEDITQRKNLAQSLQEAKEAAEAASRAKSEFLANMSHEIRTPLNGILGMTELALGTELAAHQREYLQTIQVSGETLLYVINDILDFSKIEAGKLVLEKELFSLEDALGPILKGLALKAHAKDLELSCDIAPDVPDMLVGDANRLRQILLNLTGNAIKFTSTGEVALQVAVAERDAGQVVLHFRVSDTGIGIDAAHQIAIFEPFAQADASTTRKYGGTGLGLTISARLVAQMEGRIWLESDVGRGSTFHFTARFALTQAAEPAWRSAPPVKLRDLRVLVVDDNTTNRRILQDLLSGWHMRPTIVEGGKEALLAVDRAAGARVPFGLMLIDAMMPGMDGVTLIEHLRRGPTPAKTPILILSSAVRSEDLACRERLGIADCLMKPVRPPELLRAMARALQISWHDEPGSTLKTTAPTPAQTSGLRILLAEDNVINQQVAIHMLEAQGHSVTLASNGKEALEALARDSFDLVLMDVQMPTMDGYQATTAIRALEKDTGRHLPIIALTAHAMKGDRERCLQAGMDGYLAKPFQGDELRQAIAEAGVRSQESGVRGQESGVSGQESGAQVLDRAALLSRVGGNRAMLRKLTAMFAQECPRLLAEVSEAIAGSDASRLNRAAHALKGVLGNLGALAAADHARRMEALGLASDLAAARDLLPMLDQELIRFREQLTQFAERDAP